MYFTNSEHNYVKIAFETFLEHKMLIIHTSLKQFNAKAIIGTE
jgi:hypothetical protein